MADFDYSIDYVLANEGGFTDHPLDNGGPTKYGITLKDMKVYQGTRSASYDIRDLSLDTAKLIYKELYWDHLMLERIESKAISTTIFDTAILHGPKKAVLMAQKALVQLKQIVYCDGRLGPLTIGELNVTDEKKFIQQYAKIILNRIDRIVSAKPSQKVFKSGWENRTNRLVSLII